MSGNLDDLEFKLAIDVADTRAALGQVIGSLGDVKTSIGNLAPEYQKIAAAAGSINLTSIQNGASAILNFADRTETAVTVLETMTSVVDTVDAGVTAVAFSADLTSKSLQRVAGTAAAAGTAFGVLDRSTSVATAGLQSVVALTGQTVPLLTRVSQSAASFSGGLRSISSGLSRFSTGLATIGGATKAVTGQFLHVSHVLHATLIVTDLLASAFSVLMMPIKMVGSIAVAAFNTLLMVMRTVLLPLKLLWSGFVVAAKAVWAFASPIISLGVSLAKIWFLFKGWIGSIKLVAQWLNMLPPKMRLVVGGLLALGLAGKAGALALNVISKAIRGVALVAGVAVTGVKLLALPILAIANPARAAALALNLLSTAMRTAGQVAMSAAVSMIRLGSAIVSLPARAISGAVGSVKNLVTGLAKLTVQAAAFGAVAAVALGVNFAMATEKSQAVFGVMLKDMEQGKAVVASLQGSQAVGLFDNEEVLNSGRLLFKAGVAATDLKGKTEQLATIAAATSTELGDLTRIYQQGANRGSFGQDKINQMAERGIDIYHALEATTGKSGAALSDMISSGKIGVAEMDAALAHLTEGNGIYAGSLETLAGTTGGMLSQIKNNLLQALGGLGGAGLEAFKPMLAGVLEWSKTAKESFSAVMPIVVQVVHAIKGLFTGLWSVASAVFTAIFGASAVTFGGMTQFAMDWVTKFRWYFENIVPVIQFVGLSMTGIFVTAFNDVVYWLTDTMPAYLTWFGENWTNVFTDIATVTATIFTNLASNIGNAMTAIWEFIKSGGTADLELAWTPLLTGFESTVAALPDIPERAMTELEQAIQTQTEQIGTQLADSYDQMHAEAQAALTLEPPTMPEIDPNLQSGGMKDGQGEAGGNSRKSFAVSGLEKGSEAALQAVFAAQKDNTPGQHLAEAKKQTKLLGKMAASKPSGRIAGKV
jgi:tape measure domain-containing protein